VKIDELAALFNLTSQQLINKAREFGVELTPGGRDEVDEDIVEALKETLGTLEDETDVAAEAQEPPKEEPEKAPEEKEPEPAPEEKKEEEQKPEEVEEEALKEEGGLSAEEKKALNDFFSIFFLKAFSQFPS